MKTTFLFSLITCFTLFTGLVSFAPLPMKDAGLVQDVFSLTNQFRNSKGLPDLIMVKELNAIAQKHSENMATGRAGFGHGGFEKRNAMASREIKSMH
ncbi:MAG: CAP domain-containing protein, partial [Ferruginibacter sp.]